VLTGKEEVVMLVQQCSVKRNQGLPLLIVEFWLSLWICLCKGGLLVVDLDTPRFNHC
jgi:hypothetical protein